MSKITVTGINKESFGSRMPNVFINRISIRNGTPSAVDNPLVVLEPNLSIKFTKPEHFQAGTAREFIKDHLNDVYLYVMLTYESWIKSSLEQNNFSLRFWHTVGMYRTHLFYPEGRYRRISLSYLISDDNPYGANLSVASTFDENGNEFVEISNISLSMAYRTYGYPPSQIPKLEDIDNLMIFAYTGPNVEGTYSGGTTGLETDSGLFSERYGEMTFGKPDDSFYSNTSANTYFSDISYYHVLENNRIATKFYEAYTTPEGVPYYNNVLQSVNGKFYATDEYSFDDIKAQLEALIDAHNENREADPDLNSNLENLEVIINATLNRKGVLGELSNYRSVYPNKSPTTLSGQFYSEFVVSFAEIIQIVQAQIELDTQLLYDSLVVDERFSLLEGAYVAPNPSGNKLGLWTTEPTSDIRAADVVKGVPYTDPSSCYIPRKWILLGRKAVLTDNIRTLTEEQLEVLYRTQSAASAGYDLEAFKMSFKDESAPTRDMLDELTEEYIASGFTTGEARELAEEELSFTFSAGPDRLGSGLVKGTATSELLNPTLNGGDYTELRSGDSLVVNKGVFFFDYEKAVRTQSKIAHVFDLSKMQKLFRINVPYDHYYIRKVELARNELRIDLPDESGEYEQYIRAKMQLHMHEPTVYGSTSTDGIIDYPRGHQVKYKYFGGADAEESDDELSIYASKLKYLRPVYTIGGEAYASSLTFVNFDMPTTENVKKLKFYNSLDDAAASGLGPLANARVVDGYRLMAFKFTDVMDDDVAIHNTQVIDDGDLFRTTFLEASNNLGEMRTCYSITVEVVDQTQITFDNFVSYVVSVFNEFEDFYKKAADVCSFNNIRNEFNLFFIDQISELYPDKPWVKAAYVAQALAELVFKTLEPINESKFEEQVLENITKISPETGNLFQLSSFAAKFKGLIDQITVYDLVLPDADLGASPGASNPAVRMSDIIAPSTAFHQFYNEKPIWEPIAGDVTPDSVSLADVVYSSFKSIPMFARPWLNSGYGDIPDPDYGPVDTTMEEIAAGADPKSVYQNRGAASESAPMTGLVNTNQSYNAAATFENIFFPRERGDWIAAFLRLFEYEAILGAGSLSPVATDDEFASTLTFRLRNTITDRKPGAPTADRSRAACFLDRLMEYSSMDVDTDLLGLTGGTTTKAALRAGISKLADSPGAGSPSIRRDHRSVLGCLHLINNISYTLPTGRFKPDRYSSRYFYSVEYKDNSTFYADAVAVNPAATGEYYKRAYSRGKATVNALRQILIDLYEDYSSTSSLYPGISDLFNADDPLGDGGGTVEYFGNARDSGERLSIADIIALAREYEDFLE